MLALGLDIMGWTSEGSPAGISSITQISIKLRSVQSIDKLSCFN